MLLSSSSVIKNTKVNEYSNVEIVTESNISNLGEQSLHHLQGELQLNGNDELKSLNRIGMTIIENARKTAEEIKRDAIIEAEEIKTETYNSAYQKGYEEGTEDGFNKAYEETVVKAKTEAEDLKQVTEQNVSDLINNAKVEYEKYVLDKEEEIKRLALTIASQILKKHIKDEDGINSMIKDAVEECKNSNVIIIKVNKLYAESVKRELEIWKNEVPIKGDAVVVEDNLLEDGCAILEKGNGMVKVSVDVGLENIKNELKI